MVLVISHEGGGKGLCTFILSHSGGNGEELPTRVLSSQLTLVTSA
jgi:hypothetical protein